jgi:hypothetical protein
MADPRLEQYVTIDPLALIFRGKILAILQEKLHPHVPSLAEIQKALQAATSEERAQILNRATTLAAYANAVKEAVEKHVPGKVVA